MSLAETLPSNLEFGILQIDDKGKYIVICPDGTYKLNVSISGNADLKFISTLKSTIFFLAAYLYHHLKKIEEVPGI